MTIIVRLPRSLKIETMYELINGVLDERRNARDSEIIFDFSQLGFVDPDGITVISNIIEWLKKRGIAVSFRNHNVDHRAIQYMDDCGFFKTYEGKPLRLFAATRATTIPFRRIMVEESHEWLDLHVFPWLAEKLGTTLASLAEFKTCVREIFNNIHDHSTENIGCVHIQWFPNDKKVRISVSDFGVGIPQEIARVYEVANDAAAIALAAQEGISSKPNGRNQGAGLSYLIDNVVGRNQGWLGIYSNRGQFTCSSDTGRIRRRPRLAGGFYPGTLISIDLRTDRIERVEEERESLEW
jgi:anti-sigma regulatory factor (Ser/Thr protein kinase)/anti-anti-sigma regulatory factor